MAVKEKIAFASRGTIISWWISPPKRSWRPPAAPVPACLAPFRFPPRSEIVTILRAVHKYKDSREQFEMRTHKRLIDILRPSNKTVEALMGLELPRRRGNRNQALSACRFHLRGSVDRASATESHVPRVGNGVLKRRAGQPTTKEV